MDDGLQDVIIVFRRTEVFWCIVDWVWDGQECVGFIFLDITVRNLNSQHKGPCYKVTNRFGREPVSISILET